MTRVLQNLGTHAIVWTTMVTSSLATTPHFECICPDGSRKPLCLSVLFGGRACCCQKSNAGEEAKAVPSKKKCCCQPDVKQPEEKVAVSTTIPGSHCGVSQRCCQKTLSESVPCIEEQNLPVTVLGFCVPLFSMPFDGSVNNSIVLQAAETYAPQFEPPDLHLRLRRFVI